jgi:hypothetical protein
MVANNRVPGDVYSLAHRGMNMPPYMEKEVCSGPRDGKPILDFLEVNIITKALI